MKVPTLISTMILVMAVSLAACSRSPQQPQPTTPLATEIPAQAPASPLSTSQSAPEGADALAATQWILESFGTPGAETPVVGETPLTLVFDATGQVSGEAGCNSFGGSYTIQDGALTLGEIVNTLIACVDTAVMEQELDYLNALQTVSAFEVEGDRLTLSYDEGQGVLNYVAATPAPSDPNAVPEATATPAPEAESPIADTPASSVPVSDVPVSGTSLNFIWNCYTCGFGPYWSFENGQATQVDPPVEMEYFFGHAPATNRILYTTPLELMGAGPAQITVHDLWVYDLNTEQAEAVFEEQAIVEAEWAPDGEHFAYIRATDTTYELRWYGPGDSPGGEDKLLATDVAYTFSVSPNGDKVAFTRESNYDMPGQPGLFVVDVASGAETMISDMDRAGSGSIDDKPVWSPSGQHLLLPTAGTPDGPQLVRAAADGSDSVLIGYDPALAGEPWYAANPYSPLWISDTQILAPAFAPGLNQPMGGPGTVFLFQLNEALDTIVDGEMLIPGQLIGWDVPGRSVWVLSETGDMQSMLLPIL